MQANNTNIIINNIFILKNYILNVAYFKILRNLDIKYITARYFTYKILNTPNITLRATHEGIKQNWENEIYWVISVANEQKNNS